MNCIPFLLGVFSMTAFHRFTPVFAFVLSLALGCAEHATPPVDKEAKIKASLDELSPADRKLAEEQKYCAVMTDNRLGSMGKPVKVMVKDQPVFLCCDSCTKKATADPDKTLEQVEKLKSAGKEATTK
jgi:hypothetical protein